MLTLFPTQPVFPEGFYYVPDFISPGEETALLNVVRTLPLHPLIFQGFEAKRKVKSYGYDYNFDTRQITAGETIPQEFALLLGRVADSLSVTAAEIAEVLVTEYPPGSVINWHRDAPPFDRIAGVSLGSDCCFRFRPYDKSRQGRKSILSLNVTPRSLYIIAGEARQDWEHSIKPVTETRYSITFRTLAKRQQS